MRPRLPKILVATSDVFLYTDISERMMGILRPELARTGEEAFKKMGMNHWRGNELFQGDKNSNYLLVFVDHILKLGDYERILAYREMIQSNHRREDITQVRSKNWEEPEIDRMIPESHSHYASRLELMVQPNSPGDLVARRIKGEGTSYIVGVGDDEMLFEPENIHYFLEYPFKGGNLELVVDNVLPKREVQGKANIRMVG